MNEDAVWENLDAFKENDKIGNPEHIHIQAWKVQYLLQLSGI